MASLVRQSYGKHHVRVSKIKRHPDATTHELFEVSVDVELEGDFDHAYTAGDNSMVVATDTCRNTIYVLAQDYLDASIESFGIHVTQHFLSQYPHVDRVHVNVRGRTWHRLNQSPHGFIGNDAETPSATIDGKRDGDAISMAVTAGLTDCMIAKTTQSGFSDFHQDEFRTLADTDDRILATSLSASWTYANGIMDDFYSHRERIRSSLLATFLDHYSRSVQETLYRMATAALGECIGIETITLTMPNKHHIKFNLSPFGRENPNEIFVVTDEPFGYITATVGR